MNAAGMVCVSWYGEWRSAWNFAMLMKTSERTVSEINPDVLAQLHRIHSAINDGTVDMATIRDAIAKIHDFLTGAAYEGPAALPADSAEHEDEGDDDDHPHRKPRKKK